MNEEQNAFYCICIIPVLTELNVMHVNIFRKKKKVLRSDTHIHLNINATFTPNQHESSYHVLNKYSGTIYIIKYSSNTYISL